MSPQTRPLEAVFVLSSISVVLSILGSWIFYIPALLTSVTIVYHLMIGLAHLRTKCVNDAGNGNGTESPLVAAVAYVNDVWMNIWRSAVASNRVRLEDERAESSTEPRARLHPTASLTSFVVVCLLLGAWSALLGLVIGLNVAHYGLNLRLWTTLVGILAEVLALVATTRICKRMRKDFFVQVEVIATPETAEKAEV